ncbi:negative elongation factor B-like [Physella acuta]|uniref:negative elongation factor B-like n=1 Tax=Physella acuta TaxID=109671 RepID=UPI0027DE7B2A|nr:negative elongation factor B-like [Physella acuta]XP_059149110.1 negative elongation factor B-like [Physella acuta]
MSVLPSDTGLDKIGIATGTHLNIALTTSTDPLSAIQEFQNLNGIDAESLKIALPFLDLHGVKRLTLNLSIFETVRERLLQKIAELAASSEPDAIQKLETLLDNSFPAIKNKDIRPVVLAVMKHLPKVKDEYLQQLLDDKELYNEASTEVKRQIWENNQALFGDEVQPLLAKYLKEKEWSLYRHDSPGLTFFSSNPKQRRQKETLTQLLEMIGSNVKLYDMVLQFLRTLFLRTRNTHYCTLRVELLMAIHDLELNAICSKDPCHKFTWCVDACIREKAVNTMRARELQGFLDSVKKGQEFVLGDLSMVLSDPYALNIILQSLMKMLQTCVNTDTLPRDNPDLQLLCRMTALGLNAWEMIDSGNFKEPKIEPTFFTKYLAYIVSLMAEDQIRFFSSKIPGEKPLMPPIPPDMYASWISQSPLASMVAMYYCLQCARLKDRPAVVQMLPTLIHCDNDRAFSDTFLHCLSSYLIHMKDEFQHEDFCSAVLDEFFMPASSREHVLRHLLRLLMYVHHKMSRPRLEAIIEDLASDKDMSESVRSTLEILQEKISTFEPSPMPSPEKLDSPLMSVPAPTPAPHR